MSDDFDPLVPRPLDLPREIPLDPDALDDDPAQLAALDDAKLDDAKLDDAKIFAAPADLADVARWRAALDRWRTDARRRYGDSPLYQRADLAWTRRCFVISQVWLWDELLWDEEAGRFTPERLLADAQERFGGFDAVVLWHAYPIIGIDDRNQWDHYRLVPGLAGLVNDLQAAGVRVFVDYNPWDTGTRRAGNDAAELASLVRDLGIDGVFLDTLKEGGPALLTALDDARPGVAVEGESTLPLVRLADHPMSWAQWFADSPVPGVIRSRWFEQRHQMHHVRRWNRDHAAELRSAWVNGCGVMVWEVVFGVWVGWSERDAATLSRAATVQRALADTLAEGEWTPLVDLGPAAAAAGVHGSLFADAARDSALLALVNVSDQDVEVEVVLPAAVGAATWHDVWSAEAVPAVSRSTVPVRIPAGSIGGLWAGPTGQVPAATGPDPQHCSHDFPHRPAQVVPHPVSAQPAPAQGVVVVPSGSHPVTVRYRCRETGLTGQAPFVEEWKPLPPRLHDLRTLERVAHLDHHVAVAAREVTAGELAAWAGAPAPARPEAPATHVTLAEARAYAAAVGARLPTDLEWQLAAQRPGFGRLAPLVWNLTESEQRDGRTRAVLLKGGSDAAVEGSAWYFDSGPRTHAPDWSARYLLPGPELARSPRIGFRLAWDLPTGTTERTTL